MMHPLPGGVTSGGLGFYCGTPDLAHQGKHMGTLKGIFIAAGVVIFLFGGVWFAVPGPPDRERRGVAFGAFAAGVVLLVLGLL